MVAQLYLPSNTTKAFRLLEPEKDVVESWQEGKSVFLFLS